LMERMFGRMRVVGCASTTWLRVESSETGGWAAILRRWPKTLPVLGNS